MHAVRKYLRDWAEPEIGFAASIQETYDRALVVPACREEASLLGGFTAAAVTSKGRTLAILVVNGGQNAPADHHARNARLLAAIREKLTGGRRVQCGSGDRCRSAFLGALVPGRLDVLVIDRASAGSRLPPKEGVGLARKVGFDLGLALHAEGRLASRLIFGTDADATLPTAFFDQDAVLADSRTSAVTFAFWHTEAGDPLITRATALYELSLRYYVEGLAWAGSPYAFHTVGSALGIVAEAYAAVRGMPKREAAEDFYLLNKVAKVGRVVHVPGSVVKIASRASDRTPFGTGASVRLGLASEERTLYSPACFRVLRDVLERLEAFVDHRNVDRFFLALGDLAPAERPVVSAALEQGGARAALASAAKQSSPREARRDRVNAWFDAFRTLKLIHAVRDGVSANMPWKEAILAAPFVDGAKVGEGSASELTSANESGLVTLRVRMARAEAERGIRQDAQHLHYPPRLADGKTLETN